MVADEVQTRHGVGCHGAVESVADDDLMILKSLEEQRHLLGCVRPVGVQHDHGVGVHCMCFSKTVSYGSTFPVFVLLHEHHAVVQSDLSG